MAERMHTNHLIDTDPCGYEPCQTTTSTKPPFHVTRDWMDIGETELKDPTYWGGSRYWRDALAERRWNNWAYHLARVENKIRRSVEKWLNL